MFLAISSSWELPAAEGAENPASSQLSSPQQHTATQKSDPSGSLSVHPKTIKQVLRLLKLSLQLTLCAELNWNWRSRLLAQSTTSLLFAGPRLCNGIETVSKRSTKKGYVGTRPTLHVSEKRGKIVIEDRQNLDTIRLALPRYCSLLTARSPRQLSTESSARFSQAASVFVLRHGILPLKSVSTTSVHFSPKHVLLLCGLS